LCSLLVLESLDLDRGLRTLCTGGCTTALGSRSFGGFSLTDFGLVYFLGGLVALGLAGLRDQTPAMIGLLGWLALAAVPLTLSLAFYQLYVLRAWCPLCAGVHGVVWAQALALERGSLASLGNAPWPLAALGFALAAFAIATAVPGMRAVARLEQLEASGARLRRRPRVVRALLEDSPALELPSAAPDARLGRPDAGWRLDLFSIAGCRRCEENLRAAKSLLGRHPQKLAVVIHRIEETFSWLEKHKIEGSAAAFLNGRQIPDFLPLGDLHFLLQDAEPFG
jgi:uncharacterized membrane protein